MKFSQVGDSGCIYQFQSLLKFEHMNSLSVDKKGNFCAVVDSKLKLFSSDGSELRNSSVVKLIPCIKGTEFISDGKQLIFSCSSFITDFSPKFLIFDWNSGNFSNFFSFESNGPCNFEMDEISGNFYILERNFIACDTSGIRVVGPNGTLLEFGRNIEKGTPNQSNTVWNFAIDGDGNSVVIDYEKSKPFSESLKFYDKNGRFVFSHAFPGANLVAVDCEGNVLVSDIRETCVYVFTWV